MSKYVELCSAWIKEHVMECKEVMGQPARVSAQGIVQQMRLDPALNQSKDDAATLLALDHKDAARALRLSGLTFSSRMRFVPASGGERRTYYYGLAYKPTE